MIAVVKVYFIIAQHRYQSKIVCQEALLKYYSLWYIVENRQTVSNNKEARINNDNRENKVSPEK